MSNLFRSNNFVLTKSFYLFGFLLLSVIGFSQPNGLKEKIENKRQEINNTQPKKVFTKERKDKLNQRAKNVLRDYELFSISANTVSTIVNNQDSVLRLTLPFQDKEYTLNLIKSEIFSPDFKIVQVSKPNRKINYAKGAYYFGEVDGEPESQVAITVFKNKVSGIITLNGEQYSLGKVKNEQQHILYKLKDISGLPAIECLTDDAIHFKGNLVRNLSESRSSNNAGNCVGLYIETAYDMYQNLGSVSNVTDFTTALLNEVFTLYANENINMHLQELKVWDVPDNYGIDSKEDPDNSVSLNDYLTNFRNRLGGNYNGDLAHLLTFSSSGGLAYVDVLCSGVYGVGVSGISNTFETVPTYSWSVEVITHELGHNLGSRHTHACAWNGNNTAIDGCGPLIGVNEGCDGPIPTKGTIMSYCHLVTSVGIDFSLGFGQQPGDLIRDRVYNRACLSPCTLSRCGTVGQACDDGDDCTYGEVYDEACNCIGGIPLVDTDEDGICDTLDQCPNLDNRLIGTACDDSNPCTTGETYDANCNCSGGKIIDTDNDGICDAEDTCPDLAGTIGAFCETPDVPNGGIISADCKCVPTLDCPDLAGNVGAICETPDVPNGGIISADCQCVSTSDCPGIDNELIGTACDDGNDCTTGETYDANCNCSGGTIIDSDKDGVCDTNDKCPELDDALIGTACDDGDSCTTGETYDANCNCSGGTIIDSDNDGVCDVEDQCPNIDNALIGTPCDDGNDCTEGEFYDNNCNCGGGEDTCSPCGSYNRESFEADFGIWIDGGTDVTRTTSNANTGAYSVRLRDNTKQASSIYTEPLNFRSVASFTINFSYYPTGMERNEDFLLEVSTDGGQSYSIIKDWVAGVDFSNNNRYEENIDVPGPFSANTVLRIRCDASANNDQIFIDDINIITCAGTGGNYDCPDLLANIGDLCDDGSALTDNDRVTENCTCIGEKMVDCPTTNANIGDPCDDGNMCTEGEQIDADCNCTGGIDTCGDDCTTLSNDSFESDFGSWIAGGADVARLRRHANTGIYSVRLRDNSGVASSIYTDVLDLSNYTTLVVSFSYTPFGMEQDEDFLLEISTDGGATFSIVRDWKAGTDFVNRTSYEEIVSIDQLSSTTVLRFRNDASANNDQILLDDIVVEACNNSPLASKSTLKIGVNSMIPQGDKINKNQTLAAHIFPNPIKGGSTINFDLTSTSKEVAMTIFNVTGKQLYETRIPRKAFGQYQLSNDILKEGTYFIHFKDEHHSITKKLIISR